MKTVTALLDEKRNLEEKEEIFDQILTKICDDPNVINLYGKKVLDKVYFLYTDIARYVGDNECKFDLGITLGLDDPDNEYSYDGHILILINNNYNIGDGENMAEQAILHELIHAWEMLKYKTSDVDHSKRFIEMSDKVTQVTGIDPNLAAFSDFKKKNGDYFYTNDPQKFPDRAEGFKDIRTMKHSDLFS